MLVKLVSKKDQRGIAAIALTISVVILLVGIFVGVYLVQRRTNLAPKANESRPSQAVRDRDVDLSGYSKVDSDPGKDRAKIRISGTVFEDLNKNSIKDDNEVNVRNIGVAVYFLHRDGGAKEAKYYSVVNDFTDEQGDWGVEFGRPTGIIDALFATVGIVDFNTSFPNFRYEAPLGWELLPRTDGYKNFAKGEYINDSISSFYDNLTYENIAFPVIGTSKISGHIYYDGNKDDRRDVNEEYKSNFHIILDASKSDNKTRKLYTAVSKEDGSYEFDNLPPLSQYRIKVFPVCPWVATTRPYEGLALGTTGTINSTSNIDFGVNYDEDDACVTN